MNNFSKYIPWLIAALGGFILLRPKPALLCPGQTWFGKLTNGLSFQSCYNPNDFPAQNWIKVRDAQYGLVLVPVSQATNVGLIPVPNRPGLWISQDTYNALKREYDRRRSELKGQLFETWIGTVTSGYETYQESTTDEVASSTVTTPTPTPTPTPNTTISL